MARIIIILLIILTGITGTKTWAKDYYPYLLDSQNLRGGTGQITLPSSQVVKVNQYAWGIHRFNIVGSYGLLPNCEIGLFFDLNKMGTINSTIDLWNWLKSEQISFQAKYQFMHQDRNPFDLASGIRGSEVYLVGGRKILYSLIPQIGIFFRQEDKEIKLRPFFSLMKVMQYSVFMFDYDSVREEYSVGWRFLLSPKIKFDFFLINIGKIKNLFFDNLVFGLTLSG